MWYGPDRWNDTLIGQHREAMYDTWRWPQQEPRGEMYWGMNREPVARKPPAAALDGHTPPWVPGRSASGPGYPERMELHSVPWVNNSTNQYGGGNYGLGQGPSLHCVWCAVPRSQTSSSPASPPPSYQDPGRVEWASLLGLYVCAPLL